MLVGVAEGTSFDIVLQKTELFLRKGRIAKMMVLARKIDDWRRPGRPRNSTGAKKNGCGIQCFFGNAKNTSGSNFNDFGLHFEAHFRLT